MSKTIGVLALQGDFEAHQRAFEKIGAKTIQIRLPKDLENIDGLVIPGGESTTLIKLLRAYDLIDSIQKFFEQKKAIFGTCAGSILVAKHISNSEQFRFGFIDITVNRNGYGRQIQSFEKNVTLKIKTEKPFPGVFIRAPKIEKCGDKVEVIAILEDTVVAAREDHVLVATFHPEVTEDTRIHEYFLSEML